MLTPLSAALTSLAKVKVLYSLSRQSWLFGIGGEKKFKMSTLSRANPWGFWRKIHLSSSRKRTIKWGERALSTAFIARGFTHGSTLSERELAIKSIQEQILPSGSNTGHPAYLHGDFLVSRLGFSFKKNYPK